ncbi:hypothetical protein [Oceanicaulis sp.]|uniref:hypothetical protein n=1 Tax=Oceanicaulis sp. TaxID=1924941 RepID=UPI003D27214A
MKNRQSPIKTGSFRSSAEIKLNQWLKDLKRRKPLQLLALQHVEHLTGIPANVVKYNCNALNILSF